MVLHYYGEMHAIRLGFSLLGGDSIFLGIPPALLRRVLQRGINRCAGEPK